ncbi:hypothetical protein Mal64_32900 [Pseudobythopirellula maris]|uniref:Sulfotransferase domain protein n=1 Tax=Pseudobythopirellula maris TaxID=2527991 RepID=A0A5C5ZL93_9BACT|nr:sulfotransferase [Pseudobythopirellula maris]TWT87747.1 hypothetical protein Mal64_32900 [Pseudobythopirellula maris]
MNHAPARDPLARRLAKSLSRGADLVWPARAMSVDQIKHFAQRKTRLEDWGAGDFESPLEALVDSIECDMRMTSFGRRFINVMLISSAMMRLKVVDAMRRLEGVEDVPTPKPLFVVGLPRTGTTLLYNLLGCDPGRRPLMIWEGHCPYDPTWLGQKDRRRREMAIGIRGIDTLVPELRPVHKLSPDGPEECVALMQRTFINPTFICWGPVNKYIRWISECDDSVMFDAYRFYRSQLKLLGWGGDHRPWVLKNPAHLCGLRGLVEAFPDACVVQTHRDLSEAVPSSLSLFTVSRLLTTDNPYDDDHHAVAPMFADMFRSAIRTRDTHPHCFTDVFYREMVSDPVATVRGIYERFGLEYTDAFESAMRQWIADHPQNKHGKHRYSLDQFGIEPEYLDEQFGFYNERFGLKPAVESATQSAGA